MSDFNETTMCLFCGFYFDVSGLKKVRVSAKTMRKAVTNGFAPTEYALMRTSVIQGWTIEETLQYFQDDVKGLDSDWIVCSDCAQRIHDYDILS